MAKITALQALNKVLQRIGEGTVAALTSLTTIQTVAFESLNRALLELTQDINLKPTEKRGKIFLKDELYRYATPSDFDRFAGPEDSFKNPEESYIDLDGTNSYLSTPASPAIDLSSGIWTFDALVLVDSLSSERTLFGQKTDDLNYVRAYIDTDGSIKIRVKDTALFTVAVATAAGVITTGRYYRIRLVENGDTFYIFVDGKDKAASGNTSETSRAVLYTGNFEIGRLNVSGLEGYFDGRMREVRLSNSARSTTNYDWESNPYEDDSATKFLLHGEGIKNSVDIVESGSNALVFSAAGSAKIDVERKQKGNILYKTTDEWDQLLPEGVRSDRTGWPDSIAYVRGRIEVDHIPTVTEKGKVIEYRYFQIPTLFSTSTSTGTSFMPEGWDQTVLHDYATWMTMQYMGHPEMNDYYFKLFGDPRNKQPEGEVSRFKRAFSQPALKPTMDYHF